MNFMRSGPRWLYTGPRSVELSGLLLQRDDSGPRVHAWPISNGLTMRCLFGSE